MHALLVPEEGIGFSELELQTDVSPYVSDRN